MDLERKENGNAGKENKGELHFVFLTDKPPDYFNFFHINMNCSSEIKNC
jgi:hypothetical protein